VLERIAVALESLAGQGAVARLSPAGAAAEPSADVSVPMPLRVFLTAAEAASGDAQAVDIVAALGYADGTEARGFAFAALDAVLAVVRPQLLVSGIFCGLRANDSGRARQFTLEHSSLSFIRVFSDVSLATIVHSVARVLRQEPQLRVRHGERFLAEVGELLRRHT
jgi:hypothetical protein